MRTIFKMEMDHKQVMYNTLRLPMMSDGELQQQAEWERDLEYNDEEHFELVMKGQLEEVVMEHNELQRQVSEIPILCLLNIE